jgi:putative cardiolipin synthase
VFDRYWNSEWVQTLPADTDPTATPSARAQQARDALRREPRWAELLAGQRAWQAKLESLADGLVPGGSAVHTDAPSQNAGQHNHMPDAFRALMLTARQEVMITNAYIIPDPRFVADLATLTARGVRVRVLTNSLASHDVPAVNSHYEAWRLPLLRAGVELHELKPQPALQVSQVDTAPVQSGFVGLHTKAMVIDRERSFVGSMNLDPRSEVLNTEMGVIVDSPALAGQLAERMARDMAPDNSWRVQAAGDGALQWHDGGTPLTRQPARSTWQRVENLFFKLFPPNLY